MHIVDGHEDVAWNALALGRDVRRSALETRLLEAGTNIPRRYGRCMLGLPEWLAGDVAVVFGTIFCAPARPGWQDPIVYTTTEEAHQQGLAQLRAD